MNRKYFFIYFFFLYFLLFVLSCEKEILLPDIFINLPGAPELSGYNNKIIIRFYGNNNEEGFQGYNVYASELPDLLEQNLPAIRNENDSYPTLLYSSPNCYSDGTEKSYLTILKDSNGNLITKGKTYYVALSSYLVIDSKNYESSLSVEKSVTIKSKTNIILNNQNKNGNTNEGIIFYPSFTILNLPDSITNISCDLFFKLENIDNKILPVLSVENGNVGIQDMGYNSDIDFYQNFPETGYVFKDFVIAIKGHIYILYFPSVKMYARVLVNNIIGDNISLDSDSKIELIIIY